MCTAIGTPSLFDSREESITRIFHGIHANFDADFGGVDASFGGIG